MIWLGARLLRTPCQTGGVAAGRRLRSCRVGSESPARVVSCAFISRDHARLQYANEAAPGARRREPGACPVVASSAHEPATGMAGVAEHQRGQTSAPCSAADSEQLSLALARVGRHPCAAIAVATNLALEVALPERAHGPSHTPLEISDGATSVGDSPNDRESGSERRRKGGAAGR
jgi:hypothetical protein